MRLSRAAGRSDHIIRHRASRAFGRPERTKCETLANLGHRFSQRPKAGFSVRAREDHSGTTVSAGGGEEFGCQRCSGGWRIGTQVRQITGGSRLPWPIRPDQLPRILRVGPDDLFVKGDREPFGIVEWKHTLNRIEVVRWVRLCLQGHRALAL
jgi:hypothetical protein